MICAGTLSVFQSLVRDAQLLEALSAMLACLAAAPGCLPLMAQTGLPTLVATLQKGSRRDVPAGDSLLLEGTLDLLCSFISDTDPGMPPCTHFCFSTHCTLVIFAYLTSLVLFWCYLLV
jgi:hypothetical protein